MSDISLLRESYFSCLYEVLCITCQRCTVVAMRHYLKLSRPETNLSVFLITTSQCPRIKFVESKLNYEGGGVKGRGSRFGVRFEG